MPAGVPVILHGFRSDCYKGTQFLGKKKTRTRDLHDLHKGTGQERGALRAPANKLCHVEDEVAEHEESQHEPSRHSR